MESGHSVEIHSDEEVSPLKHTFTGIPVKNKAHEGLINYREIGDLSLKNFIESSILTVSTTVPRTKHKRKVSNVPTFKEKPPNMKQQISNVDKVEEEN